MPDSEHIGSVVTQMKSRSIALCISGQIRTAPEELREIANEAATMGADVFISVWSERGQKTFEGAVGPMNIRRIIGVPAAQLIPDNWVGSMRHIFPDFSSFFPTKNAVTTDELASVFPGAVIEIEDDGAQFDLSASDSNSLRMLYKIWRANQLKYEAEKLRGQKYDRVVRVRPDMVLDGRIIKNLPYNTHELFVQDNHGNKPDYLNDVFWIGSSLDDDALSALYHHCVKNRMSGWRGIHRELAEAASAANLKRTSVSIVKNGIGNFGGEAGHHSEQVRDRLLTAIITGSLNQAKAGGAPYCSLVGKLVHDGINWPKNGRPPSVDHATISQISGVEASNRALFRSAIYYLMGLALLDISLAAADRVELLHRQLADLLARNARAFINVKMEDIPTLFYNDPVAFLDFLLAPPANKISFESEVVAILTEKWDEISAAQSSPDKTTARANVVTKILTTPSVSIWLHQRLSEIGRHDKAFSLSEKMVECSPKFWRAYELKYSSARALNDCEGALEILIEAEKEIGVHPRVLELKGGLLIELKQFPAARLALEKALLLPRCNTVRVNLLLERVLKNRMQP